MTAPRIVVMMLFVGCQTVGEGNADCTKKSGIACARLSSYACEVGGERYFSTKMGKLEFNGSSTRKVSAATPWLVVPLIRRKSMYEIEIQQDW